MRASSVGLGLRLSTWRFLAGAQRHHVGLSGQQGRGGQRHGHALTHAQPEPILLVVGVGRARLRARTLRRAPLLGTVGVGFPS